MPDELDVRDGAATAAKHFVTASRTAMEAILKPYDLGATQWWVVDQLATNGELRQRDLPAAMHVERATASEIVLTLVRKGLVEQRADPADQRQKVLHLTAAGRRLHASMPNPLQRLHEVAFAGRAQRDLATVERVLRAATQQLQTLRSEGEKQ